MSAPLLRRAASAARWVLVTLAWTTAACALIFLVLDALPGDAASQRLGAEATAESLAALRTSYGLDRPAWLRLGEWGAGLMRGDLGRTLITGVAIAPALTSALGRTAVLTGLAAVGIAVLGWGGALVCALRPGSRIDRVIRSAALTAICSPEFVVATALVLLFSSTLGWLPAVSLLPPGGDLFARPQVLVLPALTITIVGSATLLRLVRPIVEKESATAHVEAARLAGVSPTRVLVHHLLPGAWAPALQASAMLVPYLVGGTVIVERAFGFPGLGSLLVQAVTTREAGLLLACSLVMVGLTVTAYRLADLAGTSRPC